MECHKKNSACSGNMSLFTICVCYKAYMLNLKNEFDKIDWKNYSILSYCPNVNGIFGSLLEVEQTVRCSRTVWFLVMFGRFEVRFLAKITCSDMFEVRFWWFWKILGLFFINKVREQFGFWWCSRGSKFGFGPKWDVRMCSKFDPLRFGMFEVRFFDVRSTSTNYLPTVGALSKRDKK